ncbi:phytoene synthase [Mucilaginibacter pedocola]|uniref:Phytoene synthase n=2 Tax=Mucilaginibacter pedocola TaxID=1792845 RepID=A0A1S9PHQ1_9SPHI|nr:phytoene synthase [Mucilaginibacter pedocola]
MKEKYDDLSILCSKITTQFYSTSFSLGIRFLSKEVRPPIFSIYGFVRLADEIVDSFHNYDKRYLLRKFEHDCFEAIEQKISLNPILNSFQRTVNDYAIDHELIRLFLKSMEMDLERSQYDSEAYGQYILGSAQVVGLMCLQVFTGGNKAEYEKLKIPAMKLGSAFQKVNFLRDLKADYESLGRTYFPGVDFDDFSEAEKTKIEHEIESDFNDAREGVLRLPARAKKGVSLAFAYYYRLFEKIKGLNVNVIRNNRVRVSDARKFIIMIRILLTPDSTNHFMLSNYEE